MKEVKRYGHPIFYPLELVPKDNGEVVLYADHAAEVARMEKERDTLAERVRVLEEAARAMLGNCDTYHATMPAAQALCAAIGADLAQPQPEKDEDLCAVCGHKNDGLHRVRAQYRKHSFQPQPCKTCGGTRRATFYSNMAGQYVTDTCPDCKGGWGKP